MSGCRRGLKTIRTQYRRRKFGEQRLIGLAILALSVLFVCLAITEHEDCGAVFVIAPLGLVLLFSRKIWIL